MNHKKEGWWILVVVVLAVIAVPSGFALDGCFTEPSFVSVNNGCAFISEATAQDQNHCGSEQDVQECLNKYFIQESSTITSCTDIPICDFLPNSWCANTCEQVNHAAECEDRTEFREQQPQQCVEGCCLCGTPGGANICDAGDLTATPPRPGDPLKNQVECNAFCANSGLTVSLFDQNVIEEAQCVNLCSAPAVTPGQISGVVTDSGGNVIENVDVVIFGQATTTDASGSYQFSPLAPGTITLIFSHPQFQRQELTVVLTSSEQKTVDVTLADLGTGVISGNVQSGGVVIENARISLSGPDVDQASTDSNGDYNFQGIAFGSYVVAVDATGFDTKTETVTLDATNPIITLNLELDQTNVGIIRGTIINAQTNNPIPFARIFINNIFTTHAGSNGEYITSVFADDDGESYTLSVTKTGFISPETQTVIVEKGDSKTVDFNMNPVAQECVGGITKPVESFVISHIPGVEGVQLNWVKPCAEVKRYIINKTDLTNNLESVEVANLDVVSGVVDPTVFVDSDVLWENRYRYSIVAVYTNTGSAQFSTAVEQEITLGNPLCEDRFISGEAIEFCDPTNTHLRKACNNQNEIVAAQSPGNPADCSARGPTHFCAGPVGTITYCADAGICSASAQNANPFGLWFVQTTCYGSEIPSLGTFANFCAFDNTDTIFNACLSCEDYTSCFDYKSQSACEINNCAVGTCEWIPNFDEVGTGYCVDTNAQEDFGSDNCDLCGPNGDVFGNSFCTAEICTALGSCFSNAQETSCSSCDAQTTCYEFGSELECNGGNDPEFIDGVLHGSDDTCGIEICSWDNVHDTCFKDGDADDEDDCAGILGDQTTCQQDNEAPQTTIEPAAILIGGNVTTIFVRATDNRAVDQFFYCIDRENTCLPNEEFGETFLADGTLTLDIVNGGLLNVYNGSPSYFVRYYSKDIHSNREDIQTRSIIADLDNTTIDLNVTIIEDQEGSIVKITSILDEFATCEDSFRKVDSTQSVSGISGNNRSDFYIVTFNDVEDGLYRYDVTCIDDFGNTKSESIVDIEVDAQNFIEVIRPNRVLKTNTFSFEVRTTDESTCTLFDTDSNFREVLLSGDLLTHTSTEMTFTPNIFFTTWKVVCEEVTPGPDGEVDTHEKFVPFTIDILGPTTTVDVVSTDNLIQSFNVANFVAAVNTQARIELKCSDSPKEALQEVGFGCRETRSCTTQNSSCVPQSNPAIQTITNSTTLCFQSIDDGGNQEPLKCGQIDISAGFGIRIVNPSGGVSNNPSFNLNITTRIPSSECKWAGLSPVPFNFTRLITATNIFDKEHANSFGKQNFHELISFEDGVVKPIVIRCKSTVGVVSPPDVFFVGFDTTIPEILDARAIPQVVIQDNFVDLFVQTDDLTVCKFDKKQTFEEMQGKFPGFDNDEFKTTHTTRIILDTNDDNKTHAFNVSCMNLAENVSETSQILFNVDFAQSGFISEASPAGIIRNTSVNLNVETNKDAFCVFVDDNETLIFNPQPTTSHSQVRSGLGEGTHTFPVECTFISPVVDRTTTIEFTIDTTPPVITSIDDGNFTCSLERVRPRIEAQDNSSRIVRYEFELVESVGGEIVEQGEFTDDSPRLDDLNLTQDKRYFFKIRAIDEAGNIGTQVSSDGFVAVSSDDEVCEENDPPRITISQDVKRDGVSVKVTCTDETSCSVLEFDTAEKEDDCSPSRPYTREVVVDEDQFFCVFASDSAGNNATKGQMIRVPDKDGDGITDDFDKCDDTRIGENVNSDGCAAQQIFVDTDKDGLDDKWEKQHDGFDCPLDFRIDDTNDNGITDDLEDYDNDGVINKDEFRLKTDPCRADSASDADGIDQDDDDDRQDSFDNQALQDFAEDEETNVFASILLFIGVLLLFAGILYLIYVHLQKKKEEPTPLQRFEEPIVQRKPQPKPIRLTKETLHLIKKKKSERRQAEERKRQQIFGTFSKGKRPDFSTMSKILERSKKPDQKMSLLSKEYKEKKKKIQPHLTIKEKNVFDRLERLTKNRTRSTIKTKPKETKDVLKRLRSIVQKHEEKKRKK